MNLIQAGMLVTCQDADNVENYVTKHHCYLVEAVTERGSLLRLSGVPIVLASSRFGVVVSSPPDASEFAHASNQ